MSSVYTHSLLGESQSMSSAVHLTLTIADPVIIFSSHETVLSQLLGKLYSTFDLNSFLFGGRERGKKKKRGLENKVEAANNS